MPVRTTSYEWLHICGKGISKVGAKATRIYYAYISEPNIAKLANASLESFTTDRTSKARDSPIAPAHEPQLNRTRVYASSFFQRQRIHSISPAFTSSDPVGFGSHLGDIFANRVLLLPAATAIPGPASQRHWCAAQPSRCRRIQKTTRADPPHDCVCCTMSRT